MTLALRTGIVAAVRPGLVAVHPGLRIDDDPNMPFETVATEPWGRFRFREGAERMASIGGPSSLARKPVLAFFDAFTPLGIGDGLAGRLGTAAEDAMRFLELDDGRWSRFDDPAPEGRTPEGWYRKQVVAVFTVRKRV